MPALTFYLGHDRCTLFLNYFQVTSEWVPTLAGAALVTPDHGVDGKSGIRLAEIITPRCQLYAICLT